MISRTDAPRERINPIVTRGFAWFPTSHPEEQRKKRGLDLEEVEGWAPEHPWWGRISTWGAIQGYICRRSNFHHQSLSRLTSALRCVLHVRIGWVSLCTRHHFIPLRHDDRLFVCWPDSASSCASVAQIGSFFGSKCSPPRETEFGITYFSYLMYLCAYLNVAPITRTNDPTKVPNLHAPMHERNRTRNDRNVLK